MIKNKALILFIFIFSLNLPNFTAFLLYFLNQWRLIFLLYGHFLTLNNQASYMF